MNAPVFGSFTLLHLLLAVAGIVVAGYVLSALGRLFSGRKQDAHVQAARCSACGWQGRVSRLAGRCPRCNAPLGDRAARP
ncbi:MAG: hypothetical protein HY744_04970 [Deltaproteobacteria bacterium]|nr:hypothetical protein [Deltaproteobacteria bacterium]